MTNTDKMSSYGLYLQTIRVEKGITIERVAEESRIRAEILRSIEAEDHDNLPMTCLSKVFCGYLPRRSAPIRKRPCGASLFGESLSRRLSPFQ
jgi:hypothetical protein